jgi:hypothetical protein
MSIQTSEEHYLASFKNEVWLAFQCLMEGSLLVRYDTRQEENIWCIPSDRQKNPDYYYKENVIKVLLKEDIVAESDELPENLIHMLKQYVLTEKGQALADEFKDVPPDKAMYEFLSRLTITREDWISG